jgi:polyhydroxyalkanoate synthesis repressor PhaR
MPQRDPWVVVKKYSNRRLYDTDQSRYVSLDELAETIRSGKDVRVFDAKSGEDLTQATLTQIILESRRASRLLPVSLLLQLIRMSDDALAEFFGRYMTWALELYTQAKQGATAMSTYNPFATLPFAAANAFARLFNTGANVAEAPPPPPPAAPPPPEPEEPEEEEEPEAPSTGDLAALRREIEELKRAILKK